MPDRGRHRGGNRSAPEGLTEALTDLAASVGADAGAAVYLPDGEGALQLVAHVGAGRNGMAAPWGRLLRRSGHGGDGTLLVPVPDVAGGLLVLARQRDEAFSQEDRALAGMAARQLAREVVANAEMGRPATVWSRQLEAVQRIAAQLTRLASLEDVGLAICTETKQVIDYDNCRVYVLDPNGNDLAPVALRGEGPYADEKAEDLYVSVGEQGQGLTGLVAARGEPLLVRNAQLDPRALPVPNTEELPESMLLVPMRYEGRVTGVIVLVKVGVGQFDADDLRLLMILSDQAAVAIENARLLAGRDQLVGELAALLDISGSSALAADEPSLAAILARKLRDALRVGGCIISRWEEGSTLLRTIGTTNDANTDPSYDILDFPATRAVLRERRAMVIDASKPDQDAAEIRLMQKHGVATLLMLPLIAGGRTMGLVELEAHERRLFSEDEIRFCVTMANQAATVLENARLVDQLRRAADVDQVTSVNNHRYLQERLKQELARSARNRTPLAVLMIDLDGFKGVNDRHGHTDGDKVLKAIAAGIKLAVRENDIVARYGGDEFVVLMPDTGDAPARLVAERVIAGIRKRRHAMTDGTEVTLGASAGLAVFPDDARTPQALLRSADSAMYMAKRAGGSAVRRATRNQGGEAGEPHAMSDPIGGSSTTDHGTGAGRVSGSSSFSGADGVGGRTGGLGAGVAGGSNGSGGPNGSGGSRGLDGPGSEGFGTSGASLGFTTFDATDGPGSLDSARSRAPAAPPAE